MSGNELVDIRFLAVEHTLNAIIAKSIVLRTKNEIQEVNVFFKW